MNVQSMNKKELIEIIENNKEELIYLNLFDVFEYAKEYYLLRIQ